jgi:hypothetical protein
MQVGGQRSRDRPLHVPDALHRKRNSRPRKRPYGKRHVHLEISPTSTHSQQSHDGSGLLRVGTEVTAVHGHAASCGVIGGARAPGLRWRHGVLELQTSNFHAVFWWNCVALPCITLSSVNSNSSLASFGLLRHLTRGTESTETDHRSSLPTVAAAFLHLLGVAGQELLPML